MSRGKIRHSFARLVQGPTTDLDLGRAALLFAAEEYPDLDPDEHIALLDRLASRADERLAGRDGDFERLDAINKVLFEEHGIKGNRESYYDPRNSYLNEVLDRRLGIPITLAIVMIEVGRRLGVPLEGVNFPGHFLVRHGAQRELLLDPFDGGVVLTQMECAAMLHRATEGQIPFQVDLLRPATPIQILQRMLNNLRNLYLQINDLERALRVLRYLILLEPENQEIRREIGLLLVKWGDVEAGIEELECYLSTASESEDRQKVEELLDQARRNLLPIQ